MRPLHCLIVHDGDGLRVRRWADDTLVNGMPFDEARLEAGDILSVGPIDLEVVLPPPDEQAFLAIESSPAARSPFSACPAGTDRV